MISPMPAPLSPDFSRAQSLSRVMAIVLAIGLALAAFHLIELAVLLLWQDAGNYPIAGETAALILKLPLGPRSGAIIGTALGGLAPVFILYHARSVFLHFARGEVFAAAPIRHIQRAGIWLIAAPFGYAAQQYILNYIAERFIVNLTTANARPGHLDHQYVAFLFIGIGICVIAYVMSEAQRIAEEHASII